MSVSKLRAAFTAALVMFGVMGPVVAPAGAAPAQPISSATITPSSVEAGTAGHTFDIAYQVSSAPFRGYAGSQIPAAWPRPQRTNPSGPGYVQAVPGTCTKVALAYVAASATGPWIVAVDANCKANQTFSIRYSAVAAPTAAGPHPFPSGSMLTSSSSINTVSPAPVVTVTPGPAVSLAVSGFPTPVAAGTEGSATVTGVDQYGNTGARLSGDVALSSTDPQAVLPAAAPLVNGTRLFTGIALRTAGTQTLTATSAATPSITGAQGGIAVEAGPLARIELSPATATVPAGVAQPYRAEGFDAYGNSRGAATPALSIAPTGSCADGACSDTATGTRTVTATVDGISDSATLEVVAGEPVGFELTGVPDTVTAGDVFAVDVRAYDQFGNTAGDYDGPVVVTSDDPQADLPPPTALSGGTGQVTVSLRTAGQRTITIADEAMPALSTTSLPIGVAAGPLRTIALDPAHTSVEAGQSVTYTAEGRDRWGNSLGPVSPTLAVSPDGSCDSPTLTCRTVAAGTKTVTATIDGATGTATISVSPEVVTVEPETLPDPVVAEPYSQALRADGAIGQTQFSVVGGALPAGLSLSGTGLLSGTPSATGPSSFTVSATDANGVSGVRDYTLVVRDVFSVTPSPMAFGEVGVTASADLTVTVTNNGSRTVSFNFVGVDSEWHFKTFAGCFGTTLEPGASCTQTPTFSPDTEGLHNGTLRLGWYDVNDTSRTGQITVPMVGIGTPRFTASPSPADFGSVAVTSSSDRTVTVTNDGGRAVTFNFVGVDNDWHFNTFAGCFGSTLEPGASCTQTPTFSPDAERLRTGTLRLGWYEVQNTSATGQITVPLVGVGTPRFTASPSPADFGSVAVTSSSDQTVTVTNHGGRAVTFNSVGVSGEWHFKTFAGCFGTTLEPGASCTQTPTFSPDTEGFHSTNLNLGWYEPQNTSATGTITVPLHGRGVARFTASPSPADFGTVAVTNTSDRTITVTNNGSRAVTFNSVGVSGEWHFKTFAGCFGTTLEPGASCTQTPTFSPDTEGFHSTNLNLGWYEPQNTSASGSIVVPLYGWGSPELTASPSPVDFGAVPVTNVAERTITVTNNGTKTLRFNGVGVNSDWHFSSFAGCFGTELAPGASCTQSPRFSPQAEGLRTGTFTLSWYDTANTGRNGSVQLAMRGIGTAELKLTPSPVDFGSVAVTNAAERTITVTNRGTKTIRFNGVGVNSDWNFPSFAGCFGTDLAPGASCTQTPRFSPQAEGLRTGTFTLSWYDTASTGRSGSLTAGLTGIGTPELTASPSPADFGDVSVGGSSDRTITITNQGTKTLRFNGVGVNDDWIFLTFAGCFGTELAPGASCTQSPRFQPKTEGPHNGTLTLSWNDTASTSRSGTLQVPMRGRGHGAIVPSPGYADFGSTAVTNVADQTITFTNTGTRTVRFNGVGVDDDWHFQSFAGCFGTDLAPGQSCIQSPRFAPKTVGAHAGTLTLSWYDPAVTSVTGNVRVTLAGTGTPELVATPSPLAFGEVAVGSTGDQTVTVTNHGTKTVRFNGVGVNDDWHFPSFAGCFGTDLAPGQSCTQTPRFAPKTGGPHTGTFHLSWYDAVSTSRSGTIQVPMTGYGD